jgi:hypothetical protein
MKDVDRIVRHQPTLQRARTTIKLGTLRHAIAQHPHVPAQEDLRTDSKQGTMENVESMTPDQASRPTTVVQVKRILSTTRKARNSCNRRALIAQTHTQEQSAAIAYPRNDHVPPLPVE